MIKADTAVQTYEAGYNCAQSVFSSFCESLGLSRDFALKASTGFGGGLGRVQNVCGAVSGGIMVLNLLYGRGEGDEKEVGKEAYRIVRSFVTEFEACNKSFICKELLDGCELLTEEGQLRYQSENMRAFCASYVRSAVEILERMIKELGE